MSTENPLIGKKVTAVYLATDKMAIRFDVEGEDPIVALADADCCSHTWIESFDLPEILIGQTVTAVEDLDMPDLGQPNDYDLIQYYGCRIVTPIGWCVIDYRNESNGYYGGDLVWPKEHRYFYGGVHGQNVSKQDWTLIAPQES